MNGAESLVRTLVASDVDVCFTNPGTSEMHFVAALDRVDGMRCVLGLFEGVVTGAADGYARMADKPAATLLHLGPGLGNGIANLHNAKKAYSPMVNIVGEHATYHIEHDAPLTSDIEGVARPMSDWIKTSTSAADVARDGAEAITIARTGQGKIATLILPGDTAWNEGGEPTVAAPPPAREKVSEESLRAAADALTGGKQTVLFLTASALREDALHLAGRIAEKTGCRLLCQTSNGRLQRGAGRVSISKLPYPVDMALGALKDVDNLILVGAKPPVAFFAYPNKPNVLTPEGCNVLRVSWPDDDHLDALARLADLVNATGSTPLLQAAHRPEPAKGVLDVDKLAACIGANIPENGIVVNEAVTAGRGFHAATLGCPPHDWLDLTGGAIGDGIPMSVGAAIACPDRPVLCLEGDGSGMYTLQGLWTMARENLNVTVVIFANRSYAILRHELTNVGAENPGRKAIDMLTLDRPTLDWVDMARGMGVDAAKATTGEELDALLKRGLSTPGPFLIEAIYTP
ncbi:MAG: acetolactate synthase large subunit [Alphaproteobacteria bacterium]|nr:acetolactate synthase large subunit [Alphaproteobacteria bacterium]